MHDTMAAERTLYVILAHPVGPVHMASNVGMTKTEAAPERDRPDRSYAGVTKTYVAAERDRPDRSPPLDGRSLMTKTKAEPERDRPDRTSTVPWPVARLKSSC